jgi:hypothetical protein
MKVFANHVIFDEITYDRAPLIDWYQRHQHLATSFGEWMNARSPAGKTTKFRTGTSNVTGQTIDLERVGRLIKDEPEIKPLTELFATTQPFGQYDVDVMIYPPRYVLKAHTDHAMQAGIMFPILPNEPSPINFYHVPPGETLSRAREYDVDHDRDLDYSYNYSMEHPSMFRSQAIHGVRNVQVGRHAPLQRVFLRFKLLYDEFDDIVQRGLNGQWIRSNTRN